MVSNSFRVASNTVSVIVHKVCRVLTTKVGPMLVKLPCSDNEMEQLISEMERKYGFPQAFGCIGGTHIEIQQPLKNPHDYWCYKMKYSLNVQAVCDHNGVFIDIDARWPGSVNDAKVFANSKINAALRNGLLPNVYKQLLPGTSKIPPLLLGDPAYPLLIYCMKEFATANNNEQVVFNSLFRSARNTVECAFGRLKARWQILDKKINLSLNMCQKLYLHVLFFTTSVK